MTTLIGDMASAWELLYQGVRHLQLIISLNILFLAVSFVSYLLYMVLEGFGWFLVVGTRWVEVLMVNIKSKSMRGTWMRESELRRATLDQTLFPELGLVRDLRCYLIRAYRTWQMTASVLFIGAIWLAITFIFINALSAGTYAAGNITPLDLANDIMDNIGVLVTFIAGFSIIILVVTILMAAFRFWEFGVLQAKIFNGKSTWQTIKGGFK